MKIYRCNKIDQTVLSAFERLIPELNPLAEIPSRKHLEEIVQNKNSVIFLAEDNDIAGTLTLLINQTPSGKKAWIEDVVVDKNFRGQGIGTKLIEAAITCSKEMGILKIDLTSRPGRVEANNLYQKLGFEKRETNVYRLLLT